jgi:hypothetical protein
MNLSNDNAGHINRRLFCLVKHQHGKGEALCHTDTRYVEGDDGLRTSVDYITIE